MSSDSGNYDRRTILQGVGGGVAGFGILALGEWAVNNLGVQSPVYLDGRDSEENDQSQEDDNQEGSSFEDETISEMLESEGSITRKNFPDYICTIDSSSEVRDYDIRNLDEPGEVELRYGNEQWRSVQGNEPGFSASRTFEKYIVEHHEDGTLEDQLEEYWEDECR